MVNPYAIESKLERSNEEWFELAQSSPKPQA